MEDEPTTSSVVSSRPRTESKSDNASWMMVYGIAGQLAWMLALPAVIFVIGGAYMDKYFGTSPVFVTIGIPVALFVSVMAVWRMIKKLQEKK
jgi:F0F1-type ATP synthase assembly protein I